MRISDPLDCSSKIYSMNEDDALKNTDDPFSNPFTNEKLREVSSSPIRIRRLVSLMRYLHLLH
jgi:hypothetical protein